MIKTKSGLKYNEFVLDPLAPQKLQRCPKCKTKGIKTITLATDISCMGEDYECPKCKKTWELFQCYSCSKWHYRKELRDIVIDSRTPTGWQNPGICGGGFQPQCYKVAHVCKLHSDREVIMLYSRGVRQGRLERRKAHGKIQ